MTGFLNLLEMYESADKIDLAEGLEAYWRYHNLMRQVSKKYSMGFEEIVAAFVAMSPNSDYVGNVRSLISVVEGLLEGKAPEAITISTYNHCKMRAIEYLRGTVDFLATAKGPKIRAFYSNILDPEDPSYVTIDGHMIAAWRGQQLTMKDAIPGRGEYVLVSNDLKRLAALVRRVPCQVQATIWFARKRKFNIKYTAQMDAFAFADRDVWNTQLNLDSLKTY